MAFGKSGSKQVDKEIKDMINKNVASSIRTQPSFSALLQLNGCPTIKLGSIGSKIRKQLLKEAENGTLTVDSVMPRAYTLIGEFLEIDSVKTIETLNIANKSPNIENNISFYCNNCGKLIEDDSKFCPNCGNDLNGIKKEIKKQLKENQMEM